MSASILYIHGFNSAPASNKASQLIRVMDALGLADQLRVPALHHHPRQAIPQLEEAIAQLGRPLLVGSSLGGYYATHLAERHGLKALLVNPAVSPHRMFDGYLGTQKNLYTDETLDYRLAQQYYRACALRIQPGGDHGYQGFAQQLPALLSFAGVGADQYQSFDFSAL